MFKDIGYEYIRNFVSPEISNIITQYALYEDAISPKEGDSQVPNSHAKYSDSLMETLLELFHNQVEEITNLTLYPTYSYYRVYRTGMELTPHKDRQSCEISVSVCFNHSYSTINGVWPLFMENAPVVMRPGDAVVYRGMDVDHSRPPLMIPDAWHVQGFFHYVDAFGPNREWIFDKRPNLGYRI